VGERKDSKFCELVDHSKSQPTDDKMSRDLFLNF